MYMTKAKQYAVKTRTIVVTLLNLSIMAIGVVMAILEGIKNDFDDSRIQSS